MQTLRKNRKLLWTPQGLYQCPTESCGDGRTRKDYGRSTLNPGYCNKGDKGGTNKWVHLLWYNAFCLISIRNILQKGYGNKRAGGCLAEVWWIGTARTSNWDCTSGKWYHCSQGRCVALSRTNTTHLSIFWLDAKEAKDDAKETKADAKEIKAIVKDIVGKMDTRNCSHHLDFFDILGAYPRL